MMFDYFYGAQADQFTFYRIPKNLFTDKRFAKLSSDAKVLYGLMLDRMGLSAKNGWCDEQGRVYIVFSTKEVMEAMNVCKKSACKYMAELDTVQGIGLIERVRLGLGQKSRIYVLNFITAAEPAKQQSFPLETVVETGEPAEKEIESNQPQLGAPLPVSSGSHPYTSRGVKSTPQENTAKTGDFQRCKKYTSGGALNTPLAVQNVHPINNTDFSNNKLNNTMRSSNHITHSINTGIYMQAREGMTDLTAHHYEAMRIDIEEQIEADTLKEEHGYVIDEIVELITDVMITPLTTLRVAGADRPTDILREQFHRLKAAHVESALWRLNNRASEEITDMKAYMRTLLYNELLTNETATRHAVRIGS